LVGRGVLCPPSGIVMVSAHGVTRPTTQRAAESGSGSGPLVNGD
jgi:hypothetical protein